jgi:hypothetical protein
VAPILDDLENFHVHQGGKDNGSTSIDFSGVVDLTNSLVCFVHRIDEGQSHVPRARFKLRKDSVAKGFGGNAGAVGYKKYGAMGHAVQPYNDPNLAHFQFSSRLTRKPARGEEESAAAFWDHKHFWNSKSVSTSGVIHVYAV